MAHILPVKLGPLCRCLFLPYSLQPDRRERRERNDGPGRRAATRGGDGSVAAMYEQTRGRFGAEVKRRIMIGTFVLSAGYYDAYYLKAQKVRALIRQDYVTAFERVDTIAVPTAPTPAFKLGEKTEDPLQMYLSDVFTAAANLAGLPAISVPSGLSSGLPVGLQLTGRPFEEEVLLRAADALLRRRPMPRPGDSI